LKKIGATFPSKLPKFSDKLPEKSGKIAAIQAWLLKNGITGDEVKEILEDLKNTIFEDLKISNVDKEYYKLINGINP
jgi:hypothetical protein